MKHLTVGVAGHIDHGKTALVRALTGIETDRLLEERERGMSIVLGFAHGQFPGGEIDIIDVPGHERFVHTMIAGATGIAANERIMPQTREHVDLTGLLGVRQGLVVFTKSDLVPEAGERREIETEARAFLAETFLRAAPLLWFSAVTGEGLETVRDALGGLLQDAAPRRELPGFYLPVDRAFSMTGHGTVVTGTLRQGRLRAGQSVEVVPGSRRAEVRGLEIHGQAVSEAEPGRRGEITRGDALAQPGALRPTRLLDVNLTLLPNVRPLGRGQCVRLHYGTAETLARVHPLNGQALQPGETALAQLRLAEEISVPVHERCIIRALSPVETLGGGVIVDSQPQRHRQGDEEAAERVQILAVGRPAERLGAKLHEAGLAGVSEERIAGDLGLTAAQAEAALAAWPTIRVGNSWILQEFITALEERAVETVHQFHAAHPTLRGMPQEELRQRLPNTVSAPLLGHVLAELAAQGLLTRMDGLVREASFSPEAMLSPVERAIATEIESQFRHGGLKPPDPKLVIGNDRRRKNLYHFLRESGRLIEATDSFSGRIVTFHADAIADARQSLAAILDASAGATVSEINGKLGITRKYGVPLLEHFDHEGLTRRVGDARFWNTEEERNA
jgi:selenocysteine-specific elongation factor